MRINFLSFKPLYFTLIRISVTVSIHSSSKDIIGKNALIASSLILTVSSYDATLSTEHV